jgi:hypothetical protein
MDKIILKVACCKVATSCNLTSLGPIFVGAKYIRLRTWTGKYMMRTVTVRMIIFTDVDPIVFKVKNNRGRTMDNGQLAIGGQIRRTNRCHDPPGLHLSPP